MGWSETLDNNLPSSELATVVGAEEKTECSASVDLGLFVRQLGKYGCTGQGPKVGLEWLWGCSQVQWLLGKWEVATAAAGWLAGAAEDEGLQSALPA